MALLINQSSGVKSHSPIRTQRTQSLVTEFFAVFAPSVMKEDKKPQMNADEHRFVEWVSGIYRFLLRSLKLIAYNLKMKSNGGTSIWLPPARAFAKCMVAALVLAGADMGEVSTQMVLNSGVQ